MVLAVSTATVPVRSTGTNPAIDPPSLASQPTDAVVGQGYNTPAELGPGPGVSIPGDYGTYDGAAGNPDDTPSEKNSFGPGVTGPGYDPGAVGEPNGDSPSEVNGRGPGTPAAAPSPVTAEPASDPPGAAPAAAEPGNAAVNAATVGPAADQSSPAPGNGNFGFGEVPRGRPSTILREVSRIRATQAIRIAIGTETRAARATAMPRFPSSSTSRARASRSHS